MRWLLDCVDSALGLSKRTSQNSVKAKFAEYLFHALR
jgi:hypothetical protein